MTYATATASPEAPPNATCPTALIRVLVVDDSPIDRRLAGRFLEERPDIETIFASNGREALELIADETPSVVLTDLQMPEMDGLQLVEAVRRQYSRIPVILMTAYGSEEIAMQALRAGAANYVPKKNLFRELLDTLDRVLSARAVVHGREQLMACLHERQSTFRLANNPALITPISQLLQDELDLSGFCDETTRMRVGVALTESISNALYHGNLEVSSDLRQEDERIFYRLAEERRYEPIYRDRQVHVTVKLDRSSIRFTIRDEGPGYDVKRVEREADDPKNLMRIGGRGLLLIRTFMDEVTHNESGNEITLVKRRKPDPGPFDHP